MENLTIIDTDVTTIHQYSMCGYKNIKQEGYRRKLEWIKERFAEGMKYKILYSEEHGALGGIEYIPGQYAWRPIEAHNYMFIQCIFIMPKKIKQQGYGTKLVETCLEDAKTQNQKGVAVVTRKGTWMAGKELFLKNGFDVVDHAPPDFELLAKKFMKNVPDPKFKSDWQDRLKQYEKGLTIITSDQCPYTYKAITEISDTAKKEYGIKPKIVELKSGKDAQNSPCAFGSFCMIYDGKIVADHPVSNTRFKNIMNKELKV